MSESIKFSEEAKKSIENGVEKITNAIKITLGPKGRNVVIYQNGTPIITNDGATIAKELELEDEFENVGMKMLKEVAIKTNEVAGDGTTTATILAGHMIKEGFKCVRNGASPIEIKKGMNKVGEFASLEIKKIATKIDSKEAMQKVASISSNDEHIGELIADAMDKIGTVGTVTVEESKTTSTELEIVEGIKFDKGYISSYMITDTEKMEAVLDNPYILITDKKISQIQELLPIMEKIVNEGKKLLIIADDVESEVLTTLLVNKMRGIFTSVVVKAPMFGNNRKEMLKDIACVTGATFISDELGMDLREISIEDLGGAKNVKITKDSTVIIKGKGNKQTVQDRLKVITNMLEVAEEEYDIEILKERRAKLSGNVGIIRVGGITETEMLEKKMRVEDALCATKAAIEDGIVAGGGTAYVNIIRKIEEKFKTLKGDENLGKEIVVSAMEKPLKQIAINSGKNGDVILEKIKESKEGVGYDAKNDAFVDMKQNGIIDPAKVSRCALENAVSIASLAITTEVMVVKNYNEKNEFNNEM